MLPLSGWVDSVTGAPLDPTFLQAMINRTLGATVTMGGRLRVVDANLNPVDMGLPGGDDPSDLARCLYPDSAIISLDATQPVMRTITFDLEDPLFDPAFQKPLLFDPYNHFVQPFTTMTCLGITAEIPLGTYYVTEPKGQVWRNRRIYTFDGLDLTALISLAKLMSDWTVTADYPGGHIQALLDLLTSDSVPKSMGGKGKTPQGNDDAGPAWPVDVFDVDWTGNQTVAIPFPWRAGTNRMQNAGEITSAINYYPLTMSNQTKFRIWRMPDFTSTLPAISWDYSTDGESIDTFPILEEYQRSPDACNIARIEGGQSTGAGGAPFSALDVNNSPDSKLSYVNLKTLGGRPRAMAYFESNPTLANLAMTQEYAKQKLNAGDILQDRMTLITLPNPLTEWPEYYTVQVTSEDGEVMVASDANHPYIEMGWTLPWMSPRARHSHLLVRLAAY